MCVQHGSLQTEHAATGEVAALTTTSDMQPCVLSAFDLCGLICVPLICLICVTALYHAHRRTSTITSASWSRFVWRQGVQLLEV
jgi:hypothetical protein